MCCFNFVNELELIGNMLKINIMKKICVLVIIFLAFVVCDPTYIGASVGHTMPDMDNETAKVIVL